MRLVSWHYGCNSHATEYGGMGKIVKQQILKGWAKLDRNQKMLPMPLFEQPSLALTPIPRRAQFKHLLPLGALYIAAREGTHTH